MTGRRWLIVGVAIAIAVVLAFAALGAGRPSPSPSTLPGGTPEASASAAAASAISSLSVPSGDATAMPEASPIAAGTLEPLPALLALLRVAPEDRTGYDRSLFVHWIDADGNGCDTRHEVLIAQAVVAPSIGARCALSGGRWVSLYDGLTITDPAGLQIDHVVALAEAWDSGASAWSPAHREAYANDLGVPFALLAVSATTNQSKSDDDPADWLPPAAAAECPFLGDWIAVKVRWDLAVDPREHDALAADIRDCPATEMPYVPAGFADDQPGEPSAGPPPSAATSGGSCDPAYPTVCIPPPPPDLDCGDIGYRNFKVLPPDPHRFDGDHDGIGCET